MKASCPMVALLVLLTPAAVSAQLQPAASPLGPAGYPFFHPGMPLGNGYWYGYGGPYSYDSYGYGYPYGYGGTALGSRARDRAEWIRALGEYELLAAQARAEQQKIIEQDEENRLQAVRNYYELERLRDERRAQERADRVAQRQRLVSRTSAAPQPDETAANRLDIATGKLGWPLPLEADGFAPYRLMLEAALADRAAGGELDARQYTQLLRAIDNMQRALQAQLGAIPPQDYMEARKFLDRLADEIRQTRR